MGMGKDVNNLIKEFASAIKFLQNGYHKYGLNHKFSRAKEGLKKGNSNANSKFSDFCLKANAWVRKEMKK